MPNRNAMFEVQYFSPDEFLAYYLQGKSPATDTDMKTINSLAASEAKTPTMNPLRAGYLALIQALTGRQ